MSHHHSDADDLIIGRLITRRQMIRIVTAAGVMLVTGCGSSSSDSSSSSSSSSGSSSSSSDSDSLSLTDLVVFESSVTAGPYANGATAVGTLTIPNRSDITSNTMSGTVSTANQNAISNATGLDLTINLWDATNLDTSGNATALEGGTVELWHCNARGSYSGVLSTSSAATENGGETENQNWLRGYQVSGSDGAVTFATIYPGWYTGRTIHLHIIITYGGQTITLQLFLTEAANTAIRSAYASMNSSTYTSESSDGIYNQSVTVEAYGGGTSTVILGKYLTMTPTLSNSRYQASINIGVKPSSSSTASV